MISIMLALVFVLSMATVAFAVGDDGYEGKLDADPVLTKVYTANNGVAPAQTFKFTFTGEKYVDNEGKEVPNAVIPAIPEQTITMTGAGTQSVTVNVDATDYELGVYTYKVSEVVPTEKTAGVDYTNKSLYMVLTVLRDEESGKHFVASLHFEKVDGSKEDAKFTNTYDAGTLTIQKLITGNMADMNKKFEFTVVLTAPDGTVFDEHVQVKGGTAVLGQDGKITVTKDLGNTEKLEITNIPAGTIYTITEDKGEYEQTLNEGNSADGEIKANDADSVVYTNTLQKGVDTGITLDSVPFIVILAVCAAAVVLFIIKRRKSVDF